MRSSSIKHLLLYILTGTRGGWTRAKIINSLKQKPSNIHQLSKELNLDYKTIQHHIKMLLKNHLISSLNQDSYARAYIISEELEQNVEIFDDIWKRFGN